MLKQKEWKKFESDIPFREYADCFYQKEIKKDIFANLFEYTIFGKKSWELEIQIPEGVSIIKITINVMAFSYRELDFKKAESDAKKIIKNLIKK